MAGKWQTNGTHLRFKTGEQSCMYLDTDTYTYKAFSYKREGVLYWQIWSNGLQIRQQFITKFIEERWLWKFKIKDSFKLNHKTAKDSHEINIKTDKDCNGIVTETTSTKGYRNFHFFRTNFFNKNWSWKSFWC